MRKQTRPRRRSAHVVSISIQGTSAVEIATGNIRNQTEPAVGVRDEAAAKKTTVRVLVAKCSRTKCTFARIVRQKGVDPERYAVDRLVKDIKWLGYSKITIRSDNEPAIQKLRLDTFKGLRVEGLRQVSESSAAIRSVL